MSKKFSGVVGFAENKETKPGVWEDEVTEYPYYGDVIRSSRTIRDDDKVNSDLSVTVSLRIVADAFAHAHFHVIKYVKWGGACWEVREVDPQYPRLTLTLGGVYNGPKAGAP